MTLTAVCACLEALSHQGYVQENLLRAGQYFIYPRVKKSKDSPPALLVAYCPICGAKVRK